jgi:pimeloyl-ACP methyl ester carboxylesterase
LDDVDPEFLHLMSRPFITPQALYRYARCMQTFVAESGAKWPEQPLNMPVLVVTGTADSIANSDASRIFARRLNAELLDLPGGDHFAHARRPEVAEAMLRIMAKPTVRFKVRSALQSSRRQNQVRRPGATPVLRALDGGLP